MRIVLTLLLIFLSPVLYGKADDPQFIKNKKKMNNSDASSSDKQASPPKTGNFALSPSQQPGSFVSFGQYVIGKNQTQFAFVPFDLIGVNHYSIDINSGVNYGLTDSFSVLYSAPIAVRHKDGQSYSSGFEDMSLQCEYAFYASETAIDSKQATLVANATFPNGSTKKDPILGLGSMSYFLGATYTQMYVDWFWFTSHGAFLTTKHHGIKYGDNFLYQLGIGKNICSTSNKFEFILDWLIELDGQYSPKDKFNGLRDPNSGGNLVYLTPSLWFSTPRTIWQFGIGRVISQHLFGNQKKEKYLLIASFTWTF